MHRLHHSCPKVFQHKPKVHYFHFTRLQLLLRFLVLFSVTLFWWAVPVTAQTSQEPQALELGKPIERELAGGRPTLTRSLLPPVSTCMWSPISAALMWWSYCLGLTAKS